MDTQRLAILRKKLGGINTFSEFFKNKYLPVFVELEGRYPSKGGMALRHIQRWFGPWPDWVLRMIVEILRVHGPTIPKPIINNTVRFGHNFLFVMKFDGSTPKELLIMPEVDGCQLGALIGHMVAIIENDWPRIKEAYQKKLISTEDYKKFVDEFSVEKIQTEIQPHISNYFDMCPTKLIGFSESLAKAKQNTFDKHGSLKDTTLTKTYGNIVENWPEIEELSGPTELCAFLNPGMKKTAYLYESQLDRVKKICRRMDVKFKPPKEGGQTYPPGLSLPEKT